MITGGSRGYIRVLSGLWGSRDAGNGKVEAGKEGNHDEESDANGGTGENSTSCAPYPRPGDGAHEIARETIRTFRALIRWGRGATRRV